MTPEQYFDKMSTYVVNRLDEKIQALITTDYDDLDVRWKEFNSAEWWEIYKEYFQSNYKYNKLLYRDYFMLYEEFLSLYDSAKEYLQNLYISDNEMRASDCTLDFNAFWENMVQITLNYREHFNKKSCPRKIKAVQRIIGTGYLDEIFEKYELDSWWSFNPLERDTMQIGLMPDGCKRLNYLIFPYKNLCKAVPSLIRTIKSIEQLLKITGNEISFP